MPGEPGNLNHILEPLRHLAVLVEDLNEDAENARQHDASSIASIKASLDSFGQDIPIVVQKEGMVVRKGNGRLQAAKELGWTHIAAVVVDEERMQAIQRAIADNRTQDLSGWNEAALVTLLKEIHDFSPEKSASFLASMSWSPEEFALSSSEAPTGLDLPDIRSEAGQLANSRTPQEAREVFDANTIRQIVLFYPYEEHAAMVEKLAKIAAMEGLDSNTDVVTRLVDAYIQSHEDA